LEESTVFGRRDGLRRIPAGLEEVEGAAEEVDPAV
jgi:hypothetical protein